MAATVAGNGRQERLAQWRAGIKRGMTRSTQILVGSALILGALLLMAALVSYRPSDPSLNTAAAGRCVPASVGEIRRRPAPSKSLLAKKWSERTSLSWAAASSA